MTSDPQTQLEKEIREQPDVLERRTEPGWRAAGEAAELLTAGDITHVVIAARGSSDNAARYAQYLFGLDARLPVALATPWLYEGDGAPLLRGAGVIAISQSGQSPDVIAVARAARRQQRPAIAITNDPDSPLAGEADVVVPMLAGDERSVAATKTYVASLHAIAQISSRLGGSVGVGTGPERESWFARVPELVRGVVEQQLDGRERFDPLAGARALTVVGRGLQLATAYETALKLRELSGLPAEAFSLPDLLHGPVAALQAGGAVWLISIGAQLQPTAAEFSSLHELAGIGIAVSDSAEFTSRADIAVAMAPEVPAWLSPLLAVIPGQAAALRLAELGGHDVDRPRGLRKVTLTR
jgi:glucosamine--fructose-6-phosphate aminotransferase (isomerizing)